MITERTSPDALAPQELLRVLTALKDGDFSQRIPAGQPGIAREIAETLNALNDQLTRLTSEFSRITREIGLEGKFGGQAEVEGLSGTWEAVTRDLNRMASNLTEQIRNVAAVTHRLSRGDFSHKVTVDAEYEMLLLKDYVNTLHDQLSVRPGA